MQVILLAFMGLSLFVYSEECKDMFEVMLPQNTRGSLFKKNTANQIKRIYRSHLKDLPLRIPIISLEFLSEETSGFGYQAALLNGIKVYLSERKGVPDNQQLAGLYTLKDVSRLFLFRGLTEADKDGSFYMVYRFQEGGFVNLYSIENIQQGTHYNLENYIIRMHEFFSENGIYIANSNFLITNESTAFILSTDAELLRGKPLNKSMSEEMHEEFQRIIKNIQRNWGVLSYLKPSNQNSPDDTENTPSDTFDNSFDDKISKTETPYSAPPLQPPDVKNNTQISPAVRDIEMPKNGSSLTPPEGASISEQHENREVSAPNPPPEQPLADSSLSHLSRAILNDIERQKEELKKSQEETRPEDGAEPPVLEPQEVVMDNDNAENPASQQPAPAASDIKINHEEVLNQEREIYGLGNIYPDTTPADNNVLERIPKGGYPENIDNFEHEIGAAYQDASTAAYEGNTSGVSSNPIDQDHRTIVDSESLEQLAQTLGLPPAQSTKPPIDSGSLEQLAQTLGLPPAQSTKPPIDSGSLEQLAQTLGLLSDPNAPHSEQKQQPNLGLLPQTTPGSPNESESSKVVDIRAYQNR